MGQYDLETDAVLTQLNYEELSKIPGGEFAEIIGDLLALVGGSGPLTLAAKTSNLVLKIRRLAGASYASNLIYTITAVRNDLADLYAKHAELRERVDTLRDDPKFAEAIAALALRTMQTSVKGRLNRLARVVVNGVKEDDLDSESLDEMMRAAVELKESDISLLGKLYASQNRPLLLQVRKGEAPHNWHGNIQTVWREFVNSGALNPQEHLSYRSSLSRLESAGLIQRVENAGMYGVGLEVYALLLEGQKFYGRLQEVARESDSKMP